MNSYTPFILGVLLLCIINIGLSIGVLYLPIVFYEKEEGISPV
tara:strand:+ start:181 stop:309 length:129 start_codon:yes stop_codon:yes gene_type:complete